MFQTTNRIKHYFLIKNDQVYGIKIENGYVSCALHKTSSSLVSSSHSAMVGFKVARRPLPPVHKSQKTCFHSRNVDTQKMPCHSIIVIFSLAVGKNLFRTAKCWFLMANHSFSALLVWNFLEMTVSFFFPWDFWISWKPTDGWRRLKTPLGPP